MYELAVALYMGDGTVEDPSLAVKYLKKAADLGHSGAAYLLVDCYLEGVGTERNRGKALEWLMAAAEMGHRHAQRRAEALLTDDNLPDEQQPQMLASSMSLHAKPSKLDQEESQRWAGTTPRSDWYREVSLERRFSIGGGSRNPLILYRRKTAVAESRQSEA
jgi:TPR repeat protein